MKITQDSQWVTMSAGKIFFFTVVAIWYTGTYRNTKKTAYELKYDHTEEIQRIDASKLEELVNNKIVKPKQ